MLTQIVITGLGLVTRTVFVTSLGVELLGVNALLMSVLTILAIADLGLSGALMHALYRPLATQDSDEVAAVVAHATRLYRIVAGVVLLIGLALLPFLDVLVTTDEPIRHLRTYYLILLANIVVGYLMVQRTVLLQADQAVHVVRLTAMVSAVLRTMSQIAVLLLWESFLWYCLMQAAFTIFNNVVVYLQAGRRYPDLWGRRIRLGLPARQEIARSVRAMMVFRVSGVVLNNMDPVLISVLIGTVTLGYYSNYLVIIGAVAMVTEMAFAAVTPSVGNLVADAEGGDRPRDGAAARVLDEMTLLTVWIHGVVALELVLFHGDLLRLWLGAGYVLSELVVLAVALNFYVVGTMLPIYAFRSATGMFRQTRYVLATTAVLNLILSVVLAQWFGLAGILWATLIARLTTNVWIEPTVLAREHLHTSARRYFGRQVMALSAFVVPGAALVFVLDQSWADPVWVRGGIMVLAVLVPTAVLVAIFGRTPAFGSLVRRVSGRGR